MTPHKRNVPRNPHKRNVPREIKELQMKPRRNVVNTRRGPPTETGAHTVIQTLECGHELQFSGQAAIKARTAEYRQCGQCPDIDNGGKITKSQRHRQSRAGNLTMPEWKDLI